MDSKDIKVLYVIDTLYSAGAERSLLEITKRFKHIKPVFVHIYKTDTLKSEFIASGLKVYSLGVPGNWNFKLAKNRLREIYKIENPDIIHSTLFRSDILTRKLKSEFPEIPLISSFVNNSYHPKRFHQENFIGKLKLKYIQYWDAFTSGKVDRFISNSETIKTAKCKDTHVDPGKVDVIFRGRDVRNFGKDVSEDQIHALKSEFGLEGKKVFLNVSRLIERKGQKDLILAMKSLISDYPDSILLIAGGGPFESELKEVIKENSIEAHVRLLGRRSDIPALLKVADYFVFPSYFEGLPGALIEAMLSDLLIICSDIPENLECVDERSALIFKVSDIDDIYLKLKMAITTNNASSFSLKAHKKAESNFDIVKISEAYENYYLQLLKEY